MIKDNGVRFLSVGRACHLAERREGHAFHLNRTGDTRVQGRAKDYRLRAEVAAPLREQGSMFSFGVFTDAGNRFLGSHTDDQG